MSAIVWMEYGKTWEEFRNEKLANSGVLIRFKYENVETDEIGNMLIGEINEMGGTCNDCRGIWPRDVVLAYAIVYTPEVPT